QAEVLANAFHLIGVTEAMPIQIAHPDVDADDLAVFVDNRSATAVRWRRNRARVPEDERALGMLDDNALRGPFVPPTGSTRNEPHRLHHVRRAVPAPRSHPGSPTSGERAANGSGVSIALESA